MAENIQQKLMKNYQKRKLWYGDTKFAEHSEVFEIETARAGIKMGDIILEIGFGEGLFLDWAKNAGFNISGVEINQDFIELAKTRGHSVYFGDAKEALSGSFQKYNGIFLFDVLEHLTIEEIGNLFDFFKSILKQDGKILARFPNGGSPFGRYLQNSDATHVSVLTGAKIQDLVLFSGLEVKSIYNGARTLRKGIHKNRIFKKIAYFVRDLIQLLLGYLYYGENIPLDPNLTVVIGHISEEK